MTFYLKMKKLNIKNSIYKKSIQVVQDILSDAYNRRLKMFPLNKKDGKGHT